jgi:hypothetical protein
LSFSCFFFGLYIVFPFVVSFGHYIVCPFVVILLPLYCLSFCRFFFGLQYKDQRKNDKRTNNIKAKGKRQKDKQNKGKRKTTKGQTI